MNEIAEILSEAKSLARRYRKLTGKPLGITGEVAEFSAAMILGLELMGARQSGYDAIRRDNRRETKIQIKARCLPPNARSGQRLGSIQLDKEWDTVLLVLMDEDLEVLSIHEAERPEIERALFTPGSKARNERGALAVSKFKAIGREVWKRNGMQ
ncbi:MAG: hypothetical protein PHC90_13305 [Syntrophorhabdaceae bacterium]|nr:hypothetical protein [Syntrophorhabdaceae bacterium]